MATKSRYLSRPKHEAIRGGCKVSWLYFKTEEEAKAAAKIAKHNAGIAWDEGYDFGYQTPGSIQKMKDDLQGEWEKYSGLWEVCWP